jgi:hypothetical protein
MHDVIERLYAAERTALERRHLADVEETKEFLKAQGSVEQRKQLARLATERLDFEAKVAESDVRHLTRLLRESDKRVDAGRTYSADYRAELKTLGLTDETST